jgi:hypothetical protein
LKILKYFELPSKKLFTIKQKLITMFTPQKPPIILQIYSISMFMHHFPLSLFTLNFLLFPCNLDLLPLLHQTLIAIIKPLLLLQLQTVLLVPQLLIDIFEELRVLEGEFADVGEIGLAGRRAGERDCETHFRVPTSASDAM